MLDELHTTHGVHTFVAVLKTANYRSMGLLRHLEFRPATQAQADAFRPEADECVMIRLV